MKKRLGLYIAAWAVLLALFNVITFVVPSLPSQDKYTPSFWIGYTLITMMIIGHVVCSCVAFSANTTEKMFYNKSLIRASNTGLITSFIVGGICMLFPSLPYWIGIILCTVIIVINVLSIIRAATVINKVEYIDGKVKTQTFFIKSLTVDADTLMASAKSEIAKTECRKVYESIRYSDPMSSDALASVEGQITVKFSELSEAVKADDVERVSELAKEVIVLVGDRNKKCKILK